MTSRTFLFAVSALLMMGGCKGGQQSAPESQTPAAPTETAQSSAPADAATVTGSVKFTGAKPKAQMISMAADAYCKTQHASAVPSEEVVVNPNGTLKWVYVYVKSGLGDKKFPAPSEPAVFDQHGCTYQPHVTGVQAGQTLVVRNSDSVLHNVNARPKNNPGFNFGQPVKGMETKKSFPNPEVMDPVKCDVHPWMRAYIGVQAHPFFAVTGENGSFSIKNLPPGTYEIEAWHEKYGTSKQSVTVGANETKTVSFTFKGA